MMLKACATRRPDLPGLDASCLSVGDAQALGQLGPYSFLPGLTTGVIPRSQ